MACSAHIVVTASVDGRGRLTDSSGTAFDFELVRRDIELYNNSDVQFRGRMVGRHSLRTEQIAPPELRAGATAPGGIDLTIRMTLGVSLGYVMTFYAENCPGDRHCVEGVVQDQVVEATLWKVLGVDDPLGDARGELQRELDFGNCSRPHGRPAAVVRPGVRWTSSKGPCRSCPGSPSSGSAAAPS